MSRGAVLNPSGRWDGWDRERGGWCCCCVCATASAVPLCAVRLTQSVPCCPRLAEPSDEEIVNKCGFSLQAIHECKNTKCLAASQFCQTRTEQESADSECQMRLCMEAKTECEAPLNKNLSGAEVCEGDGFDRTDLDCLLLHRKSMAELTDCKAQGYLKVKRECFNRVWSNIVRTQAEALLKRPHVSDDLVECALSSCFNNTECFHNYHHELAQNPASHRVFNLTLCAFVSTDYPLECDHRNCTLDIAACKHLDTASMPAGAVVAVVLVVLVVPVVLVLVILYLRRRRRRASQGGYSSTRSA
ncbi:uncharacterized protein LOC142906351 isoform X1 [Petromyzon marinus]|uniref:uncharacterized protein LOC142906351 isoform X1 n=1 Tax=Petromyzon marinus TaxID=7757 RepID=UPI003F6F40CA